LSEAGVSRICPELLRLQSSPGASSGASGVEARRRFAIPPLPDEAPSHAAALDPADRDDRATLIALAHPTFDEALRDGRDVIEVDGEPVNPRLHLVMHEVVAEQLWQDDPPEAWATALRLPRAGFDHHEILHMLAAAFAEQLWEVLHEGRAVDRDAYAAALEALPGDWGRAAPSRQGRPGARPSGRRTPRRGRPR
jgi:hypothetical protein